jgi:hypothetical protein
MKRVLLFLGTNLAIIVVASFTLNLLGVGSFLDETGTGLADIEWEGADLRNAALVEPFACVFQAFGKLGGLKAVFETPELTERFPDVDWSVTAGNSSQITDGASALLVILLSAEWAYRRRRGLA